ncbi:hypothetical protein F6X37_24175 [Paraburkholderia sp. 31.1]|uniref:hypothetical protein n=1 Tax=Paraburkholderia sp. 31.1 TaxID=2615205 RepID=UPI0016561058|nr:hypothetical protein [Paraburkholderia sp. 31.1]MBC8724571.1 hypothetical protein [Paraburkholderia sp. 31.1]
MWDAIRALFQNTSALVVVALTAIVFLVLAALGMFRVEITPTGWRVCLPCTPTSDENAASSPYQPPDHPGKPGRDAVERQSVEKQAASDTKASGVEIPTASSSQGSTASRRMSPVLANILRVPIHTSLTDGLRRVPSAKVITAPGKTPYLKYEQSLFSFDQAFILETLSRDDITMQASFENEGSYTHNYGTAYSDSVAEYQGDMENTERYCFGSGFEDYVNGVIRVFGTPSNVSEDKVSINDVAKDFIIYDQQFCKTDQVGCLDPEGSITRKSYTFNHLPDASFDLVIDKKVITRKVQTNYINVRQVETTCTYKGLFKPK